MRIPKRLIRRVADNLRAEKGEFTQDDVQERIKERLGRELTVAEKRRITIVLRNEYIIKEIRRERQNGDRRVYLFL